MEPLSMKRCWEICNIFLRLLLLEDLELSKSLAERELFQWPKQFDEELDQESTYETALILR